MIDISGVPLGTSVWIVRDGFPDFEELPEWNSETKTHRSNELPTGTYRIRLGPATLSFVSQCTFEERVVLPKSKKTFKVSIELPKGVLQVKIIGANDIFPAEKGLLVIKGAEDQNRYYRAVRTVQSLADMEFQIRRCTNGRYVVEIYRETMTVIDGVERIEWKRVDHISAGFGISENTSTRKPVIGTVFKSKIEGN